MALKPCILFLAPLLLLTVSARVNALPTGPPMLELTAQLEVARMEIGADGTPEASRFIGSGDLAMASDGTLWTAWVQGDDAIRSLMVARSADYGATFETPIELRIPGEEARLDAHVRLKAAADGDMLLLAEQLIYDEAVQGFDQSEWIFRYDASSATWTLYPEPLQVPAKTYFDPRDIVATEDGALVVLDKGTWWYADASGSRTGSMPSGLEKGIVTGQFIPSAGALHFFAVPNSLRALFHTVWQLESGSWTPAAAWYVPPPGRYVMLNYLVSRQMPDRVLSLTEIWHPVPKPSYKEMKGWTEAQVEAYESLPADERERRERLIWRDIDRGPAEPPLRSPAAGVDRYEAQCFIASDARGWYEWRRGYRFLSGTALPSYRLTAVDSEGYEGVAHLLWTDLEIAPFQWSSGTPVLLSNGDWLVGHRVRRLFPDLRDDRWMILRFAPGPS